MLLPQSRRYRANATITPEPHYRSFGSLGLQSVLFQDIQFSAGFDLGSLGFPESLVGDHAEYAFPAITLGLAINACADPTTSADFANYGGGCTNQDVFTPALSTLPLSKFLGKHSIKAGFDFRTLHDLGIPAAGPTSLSFSDVSRAHAPNYNRRNR